MNTNLRHIGVFGLLLLVTVLTAAGFVVELKADTSSGIASNQYGSDTQEKVCGDELCIKSDAKNKEIKQVLKSLEANVTEYSSVLQIAKSAVPVTIPMHQGYYSGQAVYYIITDSSDKTHADIITKNQDWRVNHSPLLVNATKDALSKTYMFTNGVKGDGIHGFQGEVFTSTPAQPDTYSALTSHVHVTWDDAATPRILVSEKEILNAEKQGLVTLSKLNVVLDMPQIIWPEGQMLVKADKTLTDKTPFVGGQLLDIDLKNKTVTFIAHRAWDNTGKTIYYIVTDATPIGPAISMGITNAPKNAVLASSSAAIDMFHFMNGVLDSGPLGFQAGITSSAPGDKNYSPMSKIYFISWKNPKSAQLLQTASDVEEYQKAGKISVNLAKPMNADHIVNAPIVEPTPESEAMTVQFEKYQIPDWVKNTMKWYLEEKISEQEMIDALQFLATEGIIKI